MRYLVAGEPDSDQGISSDIEAQGQPTQAPQLCICQTRSKVQSVPVYMFPGQGSQRKGMGSRLFGEFPALTELANDVLGYSIEKLCRENPNHLLNETQYTQPAVFFVNALHLEQLRREGGSQPSYAIGHSLGEFNALHAAGVFDLETGLRLVRARGAAMGRVNGGAMAAIEGLGLNEVINELERSGTNDIDVANDNASDQVVISGPRSAVESAKDTLEKAPGVSGVFMLKTSGAFHSRYMNSARQCFARYLSGADFRFGAPQFPVLANVDVKAYTAMDVVDKLIAQITGRVRWTDTVRTLLEAGESDFIELGTGLVLTTLLERTRESLGGRQRNRIDREDATWSQLASS